MHFRKWKKKNVLKRITVFYRSVLFLAFCLPLVGCADDIESFELQNLTFTSAAADLIYTPSQADPNILEARSDISVRFWWSYAGLVTPNLQQGVILWPLQATPAVIPVEGGEGLLNWFKADDAGLFVNSQSLIARNVAVGQINFEFAIEFVKSIVTDTGTEHFVVAWGCLNGPTEEAFSRSAMEARFAEGLTIYAGRTCGSCFPIGEAAFNATDNPCFTTDEIENVNLPRICGAYNPTPLQCASN